MAMGYLIVYEYEGKKGNDFSKVEPFEWLLEYREKFPGIILYSWQEANVPLMGIDVINEKINIDNDIKIEPEVVVTHEFATQDIKKKPELKIETKIVDLNKEKPPFDPGANLKKAREAKKKKAELKE